MEFSFCIIGDIIDTPLKKFILSKGGDGHLSIKWEGDMTQLGMLKSWERLSNNEAVSTWRFGQPNEIAASLNAKFYATVKEKFGTDKDGSLTIKNASEEDAGYYKFRLVCGSDFEKSFFVQVVVLH